jgi:hypothetical protein
MLAATPTQFVTGERYQLVGPAPAQASLATVGEAQAEFNSLMPGAVTVVAAGLLAGQPTSAVIVFDWIGPTQSVAALGVSSSVQLTDLGPSASNPAPTVGIQAPGGASSTSSSTGTYVAIGVGVLALAGLAYLVLTPSVDGRGYAHDNPLSPNLAAGARRAEWFNLVGKRAQLPAWSDRWMMGDRYGEIVHAGLFRTSRGPVAMATVKLDKSGKRVRFPLQDLEVF